MIASSYAVVLLAGAVGLLLSTASAGQRLAGYAGFALALSLAALMPLPLGSAALARQGGWYCVMALAITLHLPPRAGLAMALTACAGWCAGAAKAPLGADASALLLVFPAGLCIGKRAPMLSKILSAWMVAVALLSVALEYLPVTPGYLPDHLE